MKQYVILDKKVGETPLVVLDNFKADNPWVADQRLAYAGRLDPMASGNLLVLIGDECKKQDAYLGLDKEYTFEVLFGFSSDTGDVLGIAEYDNGEQVIHEEDIYRVVQELIGEVSFPFPVFSSKTVKGKPLHMWTLEGRLDEIEIPYKKSTVYQLKYIRSRNITKEDLKRQLSDKIESIPEVTEDSKALGRDFRREDIRTRWKELFETTGEDATFQVATFICIASSGTYMRTLATEIGKKVGTKSLAFSIHRTQLGKYKKITKNWGLWLKTF